MSLSEEPERCFGEYRRNMWTIKEERGIYSVETSHAELLVRQQLSAYECFLTAKFDLSNIEELKIVKKFYKELLTDCQQLEKGLLHPNPSYVDPDIKEFKSRRNLAKEKNQKCIQYISDHIKESERMIDDLKSEPKWHDNKFVVAGIGAAVTIVITFALNSLGID